MPPLDDDMRWRPIVSTHAWLTERIGSAHLAAVDLDKAVAQGRVHCMCRSAAGERISITPAAWHEQFTLEVRFDSLHVVHRPRQREGQEPGLPSLPHGHLKHFGWTPETLAAGRRMFTLTPAALAEFTPTPADPAETLRPVCGWWFFVWQPDVDAVWSEQLPGHGGDSSLPKDKRGKKPFLTPEQIERGKGLVRNLLLKDPKWNAATPESLVTKVLEELKFGCSWYTVQKWIVKPVLNEKRKAN